MADPKITDIVHWAIRNWLTARESFLEIVMSEVASEIAPLVADQVLKHIEAQMFQTSDRTLLDDLARVCSAAIVFIDDCTTYGYVPEENNPATLRSQLADALQVYFLKFGVVTTFDKPTPTAEQKPWDDEEGGAE